MSSFITKERYEELKLKYQLAEGKVCVNILITPETREIINTTIWRDTQDSSIPGWLIESIEKQLSGKCRTCNKGTMKEMSIYDDMDGMLTCDKCGTRAAKYTKRGKI